MPRRFAATALAAYAMLLAFILFWPTSNVQSSMILWLLPRLQPVGVAYDMVSFHRLEVLANVAIVVPLTFLGSLVVRRWTWQEWTAYAFVGAAFVETCQGLLLPHREASFSDIVANTFGALLGAVIAAAARTSGRV